jgi:hypothetical protein
MSSMLGVTQVGERIWLVTFMRYDLRYFDDETWRLDRCSNWLKQIERMRKPA